MTKEQTSSIREKRRRQILNAAWKVFSQQGLDAANVADVASMAGVSYGTVYHYFDSKDDLFMAVFEDWIATSFYKTFAESAHTAGTATDQLRLFAEAASMMMSDSAEFLPAQMQFWGHLVRNEAIRERFRLLFAGLRGNLTQIIKAGIDNGEFQLVDAEAVAAIAIAVYDGLILQWLADPNSVDWQRVSTTLVEVTLAGLQRDK